MRRAACAGGLIAVCFCAVSWATELGKKEVSKLPQRLALLVGVSKYQHSFFNTPEPLEFPESDAQAVGDFFKSCGYEPDFLLGKKATKQVIDERLQALAQRGESDGVVMVALFGHGVEPAGTQESWFVPYNAKIRQKVDADGRPVDLFEADPASLVSLSSVLRKLKASAAGTRLLLADCCRSDETQARGRAFGTQLRLTDLPANTAALFACSEKERAFEKKTWGGGAFTKCLLDELRSAVRQNETGLGAISDHVRKQVDKLVSNDSRGSLHQRPFRLINGDVDLQLAPTESPVGVITNSIGMKLALIPAGEFLMGSPDSEEGRRENEGPQHRVKITKPFYMGLYEVTQGEYEAVMGTNPSYFSASGVGKSNVAGMDTRDFPVERVSWDDASEFCRRLSARAGESGRVYRLPTEAQWEYAARAGSRTVFPWGDSLNGTQANCDGNYPYGTSTKGPCLARTARKGSYTANVFGLHDMHGNAYEWCSDWYEMDYYRKSPAADPVGPAAGSFRVLRGGGWRDDPVYCRSAYRPHDEPTLRRHCIGFRVVCAP